MGKSGNPLIVLADSFFCVQDHQDHIRAIDSSHSPHDRIFLCIFIDLTRFSHSGCINHGVLLAFCIREMGVNRIPRSPCYRTGNDAVFPKDGIDQTRFSDIWATNQAELDDIWIFWLPIRRKVFNNSIQNIPCTNPVHR